MINTLTDDTAGLAIEIINAAISAARATDILKAINPEDVLTPGPIQEKWKTALNQLNQARVTLEVKTAWVRGEYLLQRSRPDEAAQFQQELAEMLAEEEAGEEREETQT